MTDIQLNNEGKILLIVDTSIYDDWVIEKVLYWLTSDYVISRTNVAGTSRQSIILELKNGHQGTDFQALKERISNDFIDFKNRQTIARETANIRDLLFAKAFANSDDFVEFTFKD